METFKIGTRGSSLALAQAELVRKAVEKSRPGVFVKIEVIHTAGDKDHVRSLVSFGGQGVFVKEIEQALLEGKIDLAVHSLKDVPDSMDGRLGLVGFLKREDPRDVLVSAGNTLSELPPGALVGTGSPRRVLQLKKMRPDLHCANLRGNLPSRIAKVRSGEIAATLLGAAGLVRLGLENAIVEKFDVDELTPAIGQGIVALQALKANENACRTAERISDKLTTVAARTERRWMNLLGGGCRVPMGAVLEPSGDAFRFTAYLADPRTENFLRKERLFRADELDSGTGSPLDLFAESFISECRQKGIALPSDVSGVEALASFWNRER